MERQQYLLGSFYILVVDALWVSSGYFTQAVFKGSADIGNQFKEPFFVTFYCNFLFTVNLIFFLPMLWNHCTSTGERNERYRKLDAVVSSAEGSHKNNVGLSFDNSQIVDEMRSVHRGEVGATDVEKSQPSIQSETFRVRLDCETERKTCCFCFVVKQSSRQMSIKKTFWLSALFCPVWFAMNYLYNLSLIDATLGDTTSLSTTNAPFCLILSWVFLGEPILFTNVVGIAVMIVGTFLIIKCGKRNTCTVYSWSDSGSLDGDLKAILSAFIYACYGVLTKVFIGDGSKISMSLLFGFIGICNLIFLSPLFILFYYTHLEPIKLPPKFHLWLILTVNGLFSILSDYLMAKAIVLTTPLIVSVGLCLTIPAGVLIDVVFYGTDRLILYYIGVSCLVAGFFVVNIQAAQGVKKGNQKNTSFYYGAGIMSTKRLFSYSEYQILSKNLKDHSNDLF